MNSSIKNGIDNNTSTKKQPGFWTYFVISLTIVGGMLAANVKADATDSFSVQSFKVEVIGKGKSVIMIPGLMSDARVWRPTAEALAGEYQLHLISIAGFAGTPAISGELLPRVQRDLLNYIELQQLQRPAVVGHSLGAFLAFSLASSAPDKIGNIIAVDGLPFLAPVFSRDANTTVAQVTPQAEYFRTLYQGMTAEQLANMAAQGVQIQASSTEHQQQVVAMAKASDPASVGQAVYELLTTDLRGQVHTIQSKVLLIGASGALQNAQQRTAAAALYQQQIATIANANLEFNNESRHFIMLDQPSWLNQRIAAALKE
ncbi:Pimeloyl-ACP methyl ester carboxylesterase [Arsukibacterium tuosuense]|uniref:Pimeloyl-ACP methyl ester carboxylesterase n=1 Tax=Arsukibacterium tuosuense TaxID=1323745 RepID=A0A285J1U8_9GAMM|nr:alpha/beta hydrolase [Arsukibacterium tuosuense]SNY54182.1 Pimeloyl-ACP methyl ester carboxylesterase [Arsukibacterium tuosuense]